MKVKAFTYEGFFELNANTYVLIDESDNCIIVDPGKDNNEVIDFIKESELKPRAILLTHGHFDHIRGVDLLVKAFDIPVYINGEDEKFLKDPHLNCSDRFSRENVIINSGVETFKDGDVLNILSEPIKVIGTPFHTPGSSCFYLKDNKILLSGDTLFKNGIGRTDFPLSDERLIDSSLKKLLFIPDDVKMYSGHGDVILFKDTFIKNG